MKRIIYVVGIKERPGHFIHSFDDVKFAGDQINRIVSKGYTPTINIEIIEESRRKNRLRELFGLPRENQNEDWIKEIWRLLSCTDEQYDNFEEAK